MIYSFIASTIPIKYELFLDRSISHIDGKIAATIVTGQSGPGSNGYEVILRTLYSGQHLRGESYPSAGYAVSLL